MTFSVLNRMCLKTNTHKKNNRTSYFYFAQKKYDFTKFGVVSSFIKENSSENVVKVVMIHLGDSFVMFQYQTPNIS